MGNAEATQTRYLTCAETATLLRKVLKQNWPGQKFSVRSSVYAGGASIDISWDGGPTRDVVEAVTDRYEGKRFDGMTDSSQYRDHYLLADGSVELASAAPTGYLPGYEAKSVPEGAERVSLGADYIMTHHQEA